MKNDLVLRNNDFTFKNTSLITNILTEILSLLESKGTLVKSDLPGIMLTLKQFDEHISSLNEREFIETNLLLNHLTEKRKLLQARQKTLNKSIDELRKHKSFLQSQSLMTTDNDLPLNPSANTQYLTAIKTLNDFQRQLFKIESELNSINLVIENKLLYHSFNDEKNQFEVNASYKQLTAESILNLLAKNGLTALSRSKIEEVNNNSDPINLFNGMFEE